MVNYNSSLDRTFAALTDPTRRAILARLEQEESASVSALAAPFDIKLPAVMKHLDVLDDAGLISRSKAGRTVTVRLRPEPMREAMDWLQRYQRFWSAGLDRLAAEAEAKERAVQAAEARARSE
jgi:DNA-binding transcriptional ArsR family regulator